jgi:hypothetical protein
MHILPQAVFSCQTNGEFDVDDHTAGRLDRGSLVASGSNSRSGPSHCGLHPLLQPEQRSPAADFSLPVDTRQQNEKQHAEQEGKSSQ